MRRNVTQVRGQADDPTPVSASRSRRKWEWVSLTPKTGSGGVARPPTAQTARHTVWTRPVDGDHGREAARIHGFSSPHAQETGRWCVKTGVSTSPTLGNRAA